MKKTATSQAALASQNDLRGAVAGAWEASRNGKQFSMNSMR